MKRTIVNINEDKCNGCGDCLDKCSKGALDVVDGIVCLLNEVYCDGPGPCIEACSRGAISFIERDCEPYSEIATMKHLTTKKPKAINAHLKYLKEHNDLVYFHQGVGYLKVHKIEIDFSDIVTNAHNPRTGTRRRDVPSCLRQWPIQLQLINPEDSFFTKADLLVVADCAAYAFGNFHHVFIRGHAIAIGCPKIEHYEEIYLKNLIGLINIAKVRSIHVVVMEVACCYGLLKLVETAIEQTGREVELKKTVINVLGEIEYKMV